MELIYLFLIALAIGIIIFRKQILNKILDIVIFTGTYQILVYIYGEGQNLGETLILIITAFIIAVVFRYLLTGRVWGGGSD